MNPMQVLRDGQSLFNQTRAIDMLAPLLLRLYLAPIFIQAGWNKLSHFQDTADWFGNSEWGLGLPFPEFLAGMAAGTEILGGVLLLLGLAVRWISVPLMATMLVAIFAVHWPNGWLAIADGGSWLANEQVIDAQERLVRIKEILQENGNYDWLTAKGSVVVLNNGIEFGATYFIMLFSLFFTGAGRYISLDYWINKKFMPATES